MWLSLFAPLGTERETSTVCSLPRLRGRVMEGALVDTNPSRYNGHLGQWKMI